MSKELARVKLAGYDGPIRAAVSLQEVCDTPESKLSGTVLEDASKGVPGFKGRTRPITQDGYRWFWALHFATPRGELAILFPWGQDWERRDGSRFDRAIAVYSKGEVTQTEVLLFQVLLALKLATA